MNRSLLIGLLIALIAGLLFCACSINPVAGGSSQQGNGTVIGYVSYQATGTPAYHARVRLRRADFIKNSSAVIIPVSLTWGYTRDGFTDKNGRFAFAGIDTGNYCIEIVDDTSDNAVQSNAAFVRCRITPLDTSVTFTSIPLKKTGSITGTFASISDTMNTTFLLLYGIERKAIILTTGRQFVFRNVPEGTYTFCVLTQQSSFAPQGADSVSVASDRETKAGIIDMLPLNTWNNSRRLYLNTTVSGADISGTITDFPVLIRLNASTFNFSEADGYGNDIRFTKADGRTPLAYEIEQWNVPSQVAVIWVKVDTILGNSQAQSIMMYWGNPSALAAASSTAVFETASGYAGVWHLGETQAGVVCGDATASGANGTFNGTLPNAASGAIGMGQALRDTVDFINMGDTLNAGTRNITISAWIKRSATGLHFIAGKSKGEGPYPDYGYLFTFNPADYIEFCAASGGSNDNIWSDTIGAFRVRSTIAITDTTTWHFVAAVLNRAGNNSSRLYIDGIDRTGNVEGNVTALGNLFNNRPFQIGSEADGEFTFKGVLDEVELSFTARSKDWVKLSYMNQKQDDALVIVSETGK